MKLNYTFLACFISIFSWAQTQTLFDDLDIIGAFGGPIVEVGRIHGEVGADVGGGGALVLNNIFIGGYGLGTSYPEITLENVDYDIRFRHGGLWLGFLGNQDKLIHFYSSARLGWGKAQIRGDGPAVASDRLFALTPELGFEVNLTSFMKMSITGGYRWVNGVNKLNVLDDDDFSSPIGMITFRFGAFSNDWDMDWDW